MKRRVGAILVRNKRIVATGYVFILPARLNLSTYRLFSFFLVIMGRHLV